jgi:hypothetical protein
MRNIYALETKWALVTSEDLEVTKDMYGYDTYVFNKDCGMDKWLNYDFWVIEKGRPEKAFPCTLIKDECGIHFDDILMEKVRSFVLKEENETEEDISLPKFLFVRC